MFTLQFYFGKSAAVYCSLWASQKAPVPHGLLSVLSYESSSHNRIRQVTLDLAFMQNQKHFSNISGSGGLVPATYCQ